MYKTTIQGLTCKEKECVPYQAAELKINKMNLDMKVSFNILSKKQFPLLDRSIYQILFIQLHLFALLDLWAELWPFFMKKEKKQPEQLQERLQKSEPSIVLIRSRTARITKLPFKFACFPRKGQMG